MCVPEREPEFIILFNQYNTPAYKKSSKDALSGRIQCRQESEYMRPMKSIQRTAALHNLGCKVNAYETEAMRQQLESAGYRIVPFTEKADVYVINTCSVTNIADRKSRQMISRARKTNPGAVVAAVGCYVQTAEEKTLLPVGADLILGNNCKGMLVRELEEFFASGAVPGQTVKRVTPIGEQKEYEAMTLEKATVHTRAFLKVEDGCNQFCSYCIIPYARGRVRSRRPEDTKAEVSSLAERSVREIVLTGINLSAYGTDFGMAPGEGLLTLIRECASIPGIQRIRLGSLEPGIITKEFAAALRDIDQICPHFHLSLQSGSDTVLKRMNRHYDTAGYAEKCDILREAFHDPALTTDVIVGFPGESEEEFDETKAFLEKICFYETHIFKYSPREGTRAAAMPSQIDEQVKNQRSDILIALGRENRRAYEMRAMERPLQFLAEQKIVQDGEEYYAGHTKEYIRALAPAREIEKIHPAPVGELFTGRIVSGNDCWLFESGIEY